MKDPSYLVPHIRQMTYAEAEERKRRLKERNNVRAVSRNDILGTIRDWWEAWFRGDVAALASLTSERYVGFAGNGEILTAGRAALTDMVRSRTHSIKVFEWAILEPKVQLLQGGAVCCYRFRAMGALPDAGFARSGMMRDVLIYSPGGWRVVAHHEEGPMSSLTEPSNSSTHSAWLSREETGMWGEQVKGTGSRP